MSLLDLLNQLDGNTSNKTEKFLRAPFGYPGGKSRSVKHIIPLLPYRTVYVEPFGGSAAVMLGRHTSDVEAYNDRYGGVVCFYRCLQSEALLQRLIDRLDLTIHAKEDFYYCKDTWAGCDDMVERAARWYYMVESSFGCLGRNWGRALKSSSIAGKLRNKLVHFQEIHERLKRVQIDNLDWEDCILQYDSPETVFYLDPPYFDTSEGIYGDDMTQKRFIEMMNVIFKCQGFVALSGYDNIAYDSYDWDSTHSWDSFVSIKSVVNSESNRKNNNGLEDTRHTAKEFLWIKEAR